MMEVEREKRDKLASARQKLNEYKMKRSTGKTATPAGSSKPADVPQFYQNINSAPTSYNFFNPAAAALDNNNVPSSNIGNFFTPGPGSPQIPVFTSTTQNNTFELGASEFSAPPFGQQQSQPQATPSISDPLVTPDPTVPLPVNLFQQPQTFSPLLPEQQSPLPMPMNVALPTPPNKLEELDLDPSISNPFSMPLPLKEYDNLEIVEAPPLTSTTFSHTTLAEDAPKQPAFFVPSTEPEPVPQVFSILQPTQSPILVPEPPTLPIHDIQSNPINVNVNEKGHESVESPLEQPSETIAMAEEVGEFLPSAPPVEPFPSIFLPVQNMSGEETPEVDLSSHQLFSENTDPEVQQAFANPIPHVNMFASSLFGTSENSREVDNIFNNVGADVINAGKPFELGTAPLSNSSPSSVEAATLGKSEVSPAIFNPLAASAETEDILESQIQDLPVFEVIEKSDLFNMPISMPAQENSKVKVEELSREVFDSPKRNTEPIEAPLSSPQEVEVANNTLEDSSMITDEQVFHLGEGSMKTDIESGSIQIQSYPSSPPPSEIPKEVQEVHQQQSAVSSYQDEAFQQMKSVQEALELQIEELRRENSYLLTRQTELTFKIEDSERLAHEFKLEKDRIKEESLTMSQALRGKINSLCEENQRIVKNSTEVGVDLRAKMEEKSRQLEEMQKAAIILSQSKMDFASRLDHEGERVKELQKILRDRDEEIVKLRSANADLQEKLKQEQQKDAIIHQLQDQARHYQVQSETLQRELEGLRRRLKPPTTVNPANPPTPRSNSALSQVPSLEDGQQQQPAVHHSCSQDHNHEGHSHSHSSDHKHETESHQGHHDTLHQHQSQPGGESGCQHEHNHEHDHDHHHSEEQTVDGGNKTPSSVGADLHQHYHHDHEHSGSCDHDHSHGESDHQHDHHSHSHDHDHSHSHGSEDHSHGANAHRVPTDELTELKKTLHRLQWENSTFRNDIEVLAVDAKDKRTYEEKCELLQAENDRLKKDVEQLEHVIIQLQGENDTIGDYITLYQSQKLALKECAKEKDAQLELLAREREMLLHRLEELTTLVRDLKESKSEAGSQCADDHMHSPLEHEHATAPPHSKRQIEGKIRDLLTEISSSTLIENFHPCALCSGRLMTV